MEVNNYATLDMLWSYFFATGEEKSIRRLISALELSKYSGAVEKFENSEKAEKDVKEAYFDAAFQAALWSLESNCRQHPLVLKYCETIFKEQELSKEERLWLGVLLSKLKPDIDDLLSGRIDSLLVGVYIGGKEARIIVVDVLSLMSSMGT